MARTKFKCHFVIYISLIFLGTIRSLPIPLSSLDTTDSVYSNVFPKATIETINAFAEEIETKIKEATPVNATVDRSNLRPGQVARRYNINITRDGQVFRGRAVIDIQLDEGTTANAIFFNIADLTIQNVQLGVLTDLNAINVQFVITNQRLEFTAPAPQATSYVAIIEYTGNFRSDGVGLYLGKYDDSDYIAMNLHATNARRVFPCLDEPNLSSITSFTFQGFEYETIVSNSALEQQDQASFRPLEGPSYLWGMVAHNLQVVAQPSQNVRLYTRPGITNQHDQASVAINRYYTDLNEWTGTTYTEIILNQDGNMHVMAVPDVSRDWYALSTICIWEPYLLIEAAGSVTQRKLVLINIAEGMSRQWFGYMLRIENWRHQWVISGLTSYAAYEIVKNFQTDPQGEDQSLIDMNAIFTTDVIQESLLRDSYAGVQPLESAENIFNENSIRQHIYGIMKYKAPAILRMFRLPFDNPANENSIDIIQTASKALIASRTLLSITSQSFYDAIRSTGINSNVQNLNNNFMPTWVRNFGYPVLTVSLGDGVLLLRQKRFGLSNVPDQLFHIPITFTTSAEPQFDNLRPTTVMVAATVTIPLDLSVEDWLLVNLQGQGYYRVNYSPELWERIIWALEDPEGREEIHTLNRASLVDDSFNLARAGEIDYDIPLRVALTMANEMDYAVWRAFIRNMDFLRKRLVPFVSFDEGLDDEIYVRMIRRTVILIEEELGFTPSNLIEPAMNTLTRGLVMDHVCRSGYEPCIAAAVDLFYDPNNPEEINPNIPREIRPAVYCTMVREGDESVIEALENQLEVEASRYERLIILQSLGCSQDGEYIDEYLRQTVANDSPYLLEEKVKIFEAVVSSNVENALMFLISNTNNIRNTYGGPEKLEEVIFILAENVVDEELARNFQTWVNSVETVSNLGDSRAAALNAYRIIEQNINWNDNHLQEVYDWININHAPTVFVSTLLISLSIFISLFNY